MTDTLDGMHWWVDVWDNWAKTWGYDRWEWGSAADWVAAIGTAGALWATAIIISSDKRRDQRERANQLVTWVAADPWGGTPQATGKKPSVLIENTGDAPILGVQVFHSDGSGYEHLAVVESKDAKHGSLPPGASEEIDIPTYTYGKHDRLYVVFVDANNQHWIRDAATGKYLRRKPWPFSSLWVWAQFNAKRIKSRYDEQAEARAAKKLSTSTTKKPKRKTK